MGSILRAKDSLSGQTVALKLMHSTAEATSVKRFVREAELLAKLRHPGIVAHVAHGLSDDGQPFLAMEWLEGEDLAHRLAREPLSLPETLLLLRRATEALAAAHLQGIVHRDLKPSNLFLREGRVEDTVVVDFGLARHVVPSQVMTTNATVLGTPGYMAPEQASCEHDITPSADVFSLGCVLYECLTGQQPFRAPHLAAVLAKVLFAEPRPLRELRGELPASLQVLVDRMLAKKPSQRLRDATELLQASEGVDALLELTRVEPAPNAGELAGAEQQLLSVLLVRPPAAAVKRPPVERGGLLEAAAVSPPGGVLEQVRTTFSSAGLQLMPLADGSLLLTLLPERGTATDQAAVAARCALFLKERWPEAAIVLSTGRGWLGNQQPVGEVMDRAGNLLLQLEQVPEASSADLLLDEVTAGLLGPGFQLARAPSGAFVLHGELLDRDESRPLLGQPTPCVGREQELGMLALTFTSCVESSSSRALLVTAPAGGGKSRLRHEFLRRLQRQEKEVLLLVGRGELMRTGSTCGMLGQAVRRLCGILEHEGLEVSREKLQQHAARALPPGEAGAVTEFLGELCGLPFPDDASPRLRAARADPRLLSIQVRQALVSFLQAECEQGPVLLVLEDLHWGDSLTVQLVGEALRALAERPFMVLALARPEVKELYPGLWGSYLQEISMRPLSAKASTRLVREVLGPEVSESTVRRVVDHAAGNALFLEELIRQAAEGQRETPPETVLAMLQARIQRLEPDVRQALLSASFFGRTFWAGGVKALLGQKHSGEDIDQRLDRLVELEVVERQRDSHFPSEAEYRFRHVLMQDAAYMLVPESPKSAAHRLAGAWLEQLGEKDALVLAEHYRLGQERERAVQLYAQAAEQLFERYDWPAALRCVEMSQACGASGAMLTRVLTLQATVALWMDDFQQGYAIGSKVLPDLKPGNLVWCRLIGPTLVSAFHAQNAEEVSRLSQLLLSTEPEPGALPSYVEALYYPTGSFCTVGVRQAAAAFVERMVAVCGTGEKQDVFTRAWLNVAQGAFGYHFENRPWQAANQLRQGTQLFSELGLERNKVPSQSLEGRALAALGDWSGAAEVLHGILSIALRLEKPYFIAYVKVSMALALAWSPEKPQQEEARTLALDSVKSGAPDSLFLGVMYTALAKVAQAWDEPQEAEEQARKACELLTFVPTFRLPARIVLSESLRAQGRTAEAREVAGQGVQDVEQMGGGGFGVVQGYLALAEACLAHGETEAGETALRQALRCVRTRSEDIPSTELRERFLSRVPENARLRALARSRWGEDWERSEKGLERRS
jgi:hypothetical protein